MISSIYRAGFSRVSYVKADLPSDYLLSCKSRLTGAGVVMADVQGAGAYWVMWIGKRQWEGLPGEFDFGQVGWVYPRSKPTGVFIFCPAFGSESAWSYQVPCLPEDFLRFTTLEHV